ncbi:MAG: galactokinase [Blastochloris sp.]|nr:galactokinase [Blastochloris sp.]
MTFSTYAPGRAELLGNHTDYNEGLVLSLAINTGTKIEATRLDGKALRFESRDLQRQWQGALDQITPQSDESWVNYILGCFAGLQERGVALGGADFKISSTIPIGAGLSSSAALEIATLLSLKKLYPYDLAPLELARVAQQSEHLYAGVKCGLLDQISVLMSRENHATYIDCRSFEIRHLLLNPKMVFVIIHSGAKHALVSGEYNERRESCEKAAALMGKKALRDVSSSELEEFRPTLPEQAYKRAKHVVGENERVAHAVSYLAHNNMEAFGKLMFQSHQSSIDYFENSCEELNLLVQLASQQAGCLGSRLSGGGFGGATINLVRKEAADAFKNEVGQAYQALTKLNPVIIETPACSGAH